MRFIPITPDLIPTEDTPVWDEMVQGVVQSVHGMYERDGYELPWVGYLVMADQQWVGTCAFRLPLKQGRIEIAYFTFPAFEGRGIATRMAGELVRMAFESVLVEEVMAHTLTEENASTAVLRKLGFLHHGEVQHPEDGPIWRWGLRHAV